MSIELKDKRFDGGDVRQSIAELLADREVLDAVEVMCCVEKLPKTFANFTESERDGFSKLGQYLDSIRPEDRR